MEQFVEYIIKNLVSKPESVSVTCSEEEGTFKIFIEVDPSDLGKVIGKKGNAINALRTIVRTVAARFQRKAQIELVQAEKTKPSSCQEDDLVDTEDSFDDVAECADACV
jgi:predicted RNA-binding protein YlqC (UPF0109 family)